MQARPTAQREPLGAPIVLMGLRGSGKSTVGALLAGRLGVPFVDLDDRTLEALRRAHPDQRFVAVADAWRAVGEPAFRAAECEALRAALGEGRVVLALGGGTPTAPGAPALLESAKRTGATIFYLRAEPALLRERLAASGEAATRPSLTGRGTLEEIEAVLAAREPLYQSLRSLMIPANLTPERCAQAIEAWLTPP